MIVQAGKKIGEIRETMVHVLVGGTRLAARPDAMQRLPQHKAFEEHVGKVGIHAEGLHHPMLSLPKAVTVEEGKYLKFVQGSSGIVGFGMAIKKLAEHAPTMATILIEIDGIGAGQGKDAKTLAGSDAQSRHKDLLVQIVVKGIGALQVS